MLVRPDVAHGVRRSIGMPVGVAVEAGNALMGLEAPSVVRQVELLLRKRRDEQSQAFQLLRVEEIPEEPLEVIQRDELPLGHVAEIWAGHHEDRRRYLRNQMIRQIEIEVEPRQV